ncbi:MAG TPA: hypothetical protein PLD47_06260 [Aggregatilineales bacterium]|nr:hypothetical protein [Anaerolineales bacterium]HRE47313.1 hypothetical protein [Aggregatilineales bacterium]
MNEAQAIIERVRRIAPTLQRLEVATDKTHRLIGAGQLLLARLTDSFDPYLRTPWLPIGRGSNGTLIIERPTHHLYAPGQIVSLLGPVGKALPIGDTVRALLLIAYETTPAALLMAAAQVIERGGAVALALIGRAAAYPVEALPPEIEIIRAADDVRWTERDRMITWAEQIIAVAPPVYDLPAYTRLFDHVKRIRIEPAADYLYGVFHHAMPCGVGACQACLVGLKGGREALACVDGPAFDLTDVRLEG